MTTSKKVKEIEKMFQKIDPLKFWNKVIKNISVDIENLRQARVKSLSDVNKVFD